MVNGFLCIKENFVWHSVLQWKTVKFLQNRSDVTAGWSSGDDVSDGVLAIWSLWRDKTVNLREGGFGANEDCGFYCY